MTDIGVPPGAVSDMRAHAEKEYPFECCGFLIGEVDLSTGQRTVRRIAPARNQVAGGRERRFVIAPQDLADLEEELEPEGFTVLGFYHSHPDQPAEPSPSDTEHAWPWYSYIILRVDGGLAGELGCFELDPERREFRPVRTVESERRDPRSSSISTPPTSVGR
jgi:proteasome lid subunit RPN8/RPN11